MFMPNEPFPLWKIWKMIGFEERLFFLVLFLVTIYCLFATAKIVLRIRTARGLNPDQSRESIQLSLRGTSKLLSNVQQTIGGAFYLFGLGLVLFVNLATIGITVDNSKTPLGFIILNNFLIQCAFAGNAFFAFLVLHLIQWFAARQVNSSSERL